MKLTILDLTHVDDVTFPIEAGGEPVRLVTGDRKTLWAEDEDGHTWVKEPANSFMPSRWRRCVTVSTTPREPT